MKKIILSTLALFGMLNVSAENGIQIMPCVIAAGADATTVININNEFDIYTLAFDLYTPAGIRVYTNKSGNLVSSSFGMNNEDGRTTYYDDDEEDDVTAFSAAGATLVAGAFKTESDGEFFRVGGTGQFPLHGNSGKVFNIRFKVDAGVAPGVYPVFMKNVSLLDDHDAGVENAVYVSYIVVGTPAAGQNVTFAAGEIPSFVNQKLATETSIGLLDLSAVTASHGTFTYVDGREVVAPTADFPATAAYSKAVASGKYASLTMPFDADLTDKGAYVLGSVSGTTANFTEATNVNAGDVVLLTKDVNLEGTKLGAATKSVQSDVFYVSPDGTELHKGTNVTIPALRGYWSIPSASNLRIALDGVLTDINMVDVQGEGAQVFDLQGRQVQNAKNGVFVVNGKKQFVK